MFYKLFINEGLDLQTVLQLKLSSINQNHTVFELLNYSPLLGNILRK